MKIAPLFTLLISISITASAQFGFAPSFIPMGGGFAHSKTKIANGNPKELEGKKIQVSFVYNGMAVADYSSEREFIDAMVAHYEKKKAGRGVQWAADWQADKDERFKKSFIDKFNQLGAQSDNHAQLDTAGASYYLIITTTSLDPGYNAWIAKDPARIDATCDFRDQSGQTVLLVTMEHVPGQTFGADDMDLHVRVGECYAKLAKDLYKAISKKWKKKFVENNWD